MIIDSHAHLFSGRIIASVSARKGLVEMLHLDVEGARRRSRADDLRREASAAGVERCLLLPTAPAAEVASTNERQIEEFRDDPYLKTAGTLHPEYDQNSVELQRLMDAGIRSIKLCSFSQGFALDAPQTLRLFDLIKDHNSRGRSPFFVVLDTFYQADRFFGTDRAFLTTPVRLGRLVRSYPEIVFVAAHMGGLSAPFQETLKHLPPLENLYLGTSNAAHTLEEKEFLTLIDRHGPGRVLFGTDWPWFGHEQEIEKVDGLFDTMGLNTEERERIFSRNAVEHLGL